MDPLWCPYYPHASDASVVPPEEEVVPLEEEEEEDPLVAEIGEEQEKARHQEPHPTQVYPTRA